MGAVKDFVNRRFSEIAEGFEGVDTHRVQMNIRLSTKDYFLLNEIGMVLDMGRASTAGTALLSNAIREATYELEIDFDNVDVRERYEEFKKDREV